MDESAVVETSRETLTIEVYADVACPWCWIGEQRLERALAARPELRVERHWRPFLLQPDLPPAGIPWAAFVDGKFGGIDRAAPMFAHVASVGAQDGLEFRFDRITRASNTRDAHRLILFARSHGREWAVAHALFEAYFRDGVDVSDRDALLGIAEAQGMPREAAAAWLDSREGEAMVEQSRVMASRLGIRGVPFVVVNGVLGVSGAQPTEVFLQALDEGGR
ncbi:MAG: DsbA family oxidoreductase [Gemmatimonadaceae bacterium]|nr:DsbA family oxidoreductase [Gemmatimonadaceae bacterium]